MKIVKYTSDRVLDPQEVTGSVLLVAWGEIGGERYTWAEYRDDVEPGTVPQDFVDTAAVAFERAREALT